MKTIKRVLAVALLAIGVSSQASAFCAGDTTNVPEKPVAPFALDKSSFFTVDGSAVLIVSGAHFANGAPAKLSVTFPGQCKKRSGSTVACTVKVRGTQRVKMHVYNPHKRKAFYDWICYSE